MIYEIRQTLSYHLFDNDNLSTNKKVFVIFNFRFFFFKSAELQFNFLFPMFAISITINRIIEYTSYFKQKILDASDC